MNLAKSSSNIRPFPIKPPSFELLIRRNKKFKDDFSNNSLFKLMRSGYFDSEEKRQSFLDYFQIWPIYFQKTMLVKTALCDDPGFTPMFYQHFKEELGHDQVLAKDRQRMRKGLGVEVKKDAILEALCSWFLLKMFSFSPYEQVVVINLCMEAAAVFFFRFAVPAIDPTNQIEHFQLHNNEAEQRHEKMGLDLLENLTETQYARLFDVQEDTWTICGALMQHIAELVVRDHSNKESENNRKRETSVVDLDLNAAS
jgi:hypothetical protein